VPSFYRTLLEAATETPAKSYSLAKAGKDLGMANGRAEP
jgi:hypothetical protein